MLTLRKKLFSSLCKCFKLRRPKPQENDFAEDFKTFNKQKLKKFLVLDLDKTLVYCTSHSKLNKQADVVRKLSGFKQPVQIFIRNHCLEFIRTMSWYYELVLYTASTKEYADALLEIIDPLGLIQTRFYRQDCIITKNQTQKDLSKLRAAYCDIVWIDDSDIVFHRNSENGIVIKPFKGNKNDNELYSLTPFLISLSLKLDVRPVQSNLKQYRRKYKIQTNNQLQTHVPQLQIPQEIENFTTNALNTQEKGCKTFSSRSYSIIENHNKSSCGISPLRQTKHDNDRVVKRYTSKSRKTSPNPANINRKNNNVSSTSIEGILNQGKKVPS